MEWRRETEGVTIQGRRIGAYLTPTEEEADLKRELSLLDALLGDTRVRLRHGQTPFASLQKLIDIDLEIRTALARPASAELQLDARRLMARLRALDPR